MPILVGKFCPVCKEQFDIEIKRINAGQGIYCSCFCATMAKYKGGRKASAKRNREKHKNERLVYNLEYNRNYRKTIRGHLVLLFHHLKNRCRNPLYRAYHRYGGRGIKCLFKSSAEFANYVINVLKINPHGLEIHRINNNKHYEPGNIEFLTSKEHGLKHRKAGQ